MEHNDIITAVVLSDNTTSISFTELCHMHHMSEDALNDLLEHGLFSHLTSEIKQAAFNQDMLNRLQSARRLQTDLGINSPGVVLVLELRDELEMLRNQLTILRRHVDAS